MKLEFICEILMAAILMAPPSPAGENSLRRSQRSGRFSLAESTNQFSLHLYKKLSSGKGNLFFCPYSIHSALTMTWAGARKKTARDMARVLCLPAAPDRIHPASASLRQAILRPLPEGDEESESYSLLVASSLWGQRGLPWKKELMSLLNSAYGAGFQEVDFLRAPGKIRGSINSWIQEHTAGKIKELIPEGMLDADPVNWTCLVLANAVYFRARWSMEFKVQDSRKAPFHLTASKRIQVPTMHQSTTFPYFEASLFQAVELPYLEGEVSMVIFLPRGIEGLPSLEKIFTANNLSRWLGQFKEREVKLYLPKWRTTSSFHLSGALKSMGMSSAFGGRANLSGLFDSRRRLPASIDDVLHRGWIEVDERGTEAAAATGVEIFVFYGSSGPVLFRADHPFLYLIRHKKSGVILFLGRVLDPRGP